MSTCQTFTHHVGVYVRVECAIHPRFVVDVPPQPKGAEKTTRQLAAEAQRAHEEGTETT